MPVLPHMAPLYRICIQKNFFGKIKYETLGFRTLSFPYKEYVRKESLQLHIKSNHTAKKLRVFDCPYDCSSFFIHWNELSIHIKTHHSRTDNLQMFTKKTNILERALEVFQTDINHFDISSFEQLITHNKIMRDTTNLLRQQVNNIDMIYWNCFVFLLF